MSYQKKTVFLVDASRVNLYTDCQYTITTMLMKFWLYIERILTLWMFWNKMIGSVTAIFWVTTYCPKALGNITKYKNIYSFIDLSMILKLCQPKWKGVATQFFW